MYVRLYLALLFIYGTGDEVEISNQKSTKSVLMAVSISQKVTPILIPCQ